MFYDYTTGKFLEYLTTQITSPSEVQERLVRAYLAVLDGTSWTLNDQARAIRILLRFWFAEKHLPSSVTFDIRRVEKRWLPVLTADQVKQVLSECSVREKSIVMLFVGTGLRRYVVIALNW